MYRILTVIALNIFLSIIALPQESLPAPSDIKFTVIYEDIASGDSITGDQGFACMVQIGDRSFLFDAGRVASVMQKNVEALDIDCSGIEMIYISHLHSDHINGLPGIISKCNNPLLIIPSDFPSTQTERAKGYVEETLLESEDMVSETISRGEPFMINDYLWSTGPMDSKSFEQALIIDTSAGLIVMVGCSHPGIVEIVNRARNLMNKEVLFVIGGFHMGSDDTEKAHSIAAQLKPLTRYIAACHCTSVECREEIRNVFKEGFIRLETGSSFQIPDYN